MKNISITQTDYFYSCNCLARRNSWDSQKRQELGSWSNRKN